MMVWIVALLVGVLFLIEVIECDERREREVTEAQTREYLVKKCDELIEDGDETLSETVQDLDRILDLCARGHHIEAWRELLAVQERLTGVDSSDAAKPARWVVEG